MKNSMILCLRSLGGWLLGFSHPTGDAGYGSTRKSSGWQLVFLSMPTLTVTGCCPSFALPLSGARHIVHSDFIYWFTQILLRNPVVRGAADSGLGVGMETALMVFFLRTEKACNKSFKSNRAPSTELFQAVSGSARLPQAILHLILPRSSERFPLYKQFWLWFGFFF